jgi:thiamine kinase
MSPADLGAEALGLRGDQVVSVTLLRDGVTNDSWLVRTANDAVVVRINNPHAQALHVDREAESEVLRIVAAASIGPEVLLCDPHRHALVTRYLGPTCTADDMHAPERIERLARLLRKLHALAPSCSLQRVQWSDVVADYAATLTTLNRAADVLDADRKARALALAAELESTSHSPRVCHNDVHHLNLVDRGELRLLDWEYAGLGEPYFDLASVAFYAQFDLDERALLLRAYEGALEAAMLERLAKACAVFEYVHDLWHEVRAHLDGEAAARKVR